VAASFLPSFLLFMAKTRGANFALSVDVAIFPVQICQYNPLNCVSDAIYVQNKTFYVKTIEKSK
jgi:hypothetical protein